MGRRTSMLVPVVVLALLAAACGNSDDGESATTGAPPTTSATTAPQATEAPVTEAPSTDAPSTDAPDGTVTTEAPATDAPSTEAPAEEYPDRDTFVALEGVPGVTENEIQFASISVKANNPLGTDVMDAYNAGIQAYFDWRNEEGGVYGRQLVLADKIDDEFGLNQQKALELIGADNRFGVFVATLLFTGSNDLNEAGIPTFVWNISPTEFANRPAIFGNTGAGCIGCTSRVQPYLASLAGATKVAAIGYGASENSKVCTDSHAASYERYAGELGLEVVYTNNNLAFGLPNGIGPEVTAMKDAGAQFISTCMDLNGMKTLATELQRQGMDDVVLYHPNTYNQQFVADAGGIFDGDYVVPSFAAFEYDTGLEMQQKFFEYMDAQGVTVSELAMVGWINADQAFTGLMEAGPEFDQQAVIDASNQLTAYDAGGLVSPIDWTRQHTPPTPGDPTTGPAQECFSSVQVQDGAFVPVGEADKPFLCWSNENLDWSEPVPTSFGG